MDIREARQRGLTVPLRRANWTGGIVNAPSPVRRDRGIGSVLDRPKRNYTVILRGPMRGKKLSKFQRVPLGPLGPLDNLGDRVNRAIRQRRAVAEAFGERSTLLAEKLARLQREWRDL